MAGLEIMQKYAERCAQKLGLTETPTLRFSGGDCSLRRGHNAHAHISPEGKMPLGTICIRRGLVDWRKTVAHEVTHFKVTNHNSLSFFKHLIALGQAQHSQKVRVLAQKRHVHRYSLYTGHITTEYGRQCYVCGKKQVALITWKDV